MTRILEHIIEPKRLLLTWQPVDESASARTRRVVGCLEEIDGQSVFRYIKDSEDFHKAQEAGFEGYPAFRINDVKESHIGAIESFLRRVPPRKRDDFGKYLTQHRLPMPFGYSDMTLLGYTGARLPSDGFSFVPDFAPEDVPCDFLLEVAGVRHVLKDHPDFDLGSLQLLEPVSFQTQVENEIDPDAITILHDGRPIGYVNRALRKTFRSWLDTKQVTATIERLNGKPERPLVYLLVQVQ
jgi:hypothetical protein